MSDLDPVCADAAGNGLRERKQGAKRAKYAARACQLCKRRKVKCSGEDTCAQCLSRNCDCRYSPTLPADGDHQEEPSRSLRHRAASRVADSQLRPTQLPPADLPFSPWTATGYADPRVDELDERVKILERTQARLLEVAKATDGVSPGGPFRSVRTRANDTNDDDEDSANQFTAPVTAHDDLSLSSQITTMNALLSKPPSPRPSSVKPNTQVELLLELPDAPSLQHLLEVYFRDFDCYFPFLDRQDTESRIHSTFRRLGYGDYNRILVVTIEDLSTIALACFMLAMAECIDPDEGARDGENKPGWEKYQHGCRAIQRVSHNKTLDLNVVRAQCLAAAYLLHNEALGGASQAVSVAWRLATSIRLHDKEAWPTGAPKDALLRQRLFWTIYFLDRQISRRSGIAYHIRDTEFDVDDFSANASESDLSCIYIQALASLARLWGHMWDTLFAIGATKKGDWMEVEIMDARILGIRRQLPAVFTWDSDQLANYTLAGEDEPHVRRRLQLYTRLVLLRMLIRQNPMRQAAFNPETAHMCSRLSREVIHAHHQFISRYSGARAIGYFTTSSIVECIYHLAPVMHHSEDNEEQAASVSAFKQAHSILVRLSLYNNVAKKALKALNGYVEKWGSHHDARSNGDGRPNSVTDNNAMHAGLQDLPSDPCGSNRPLLADGFGVDFGSWMDTSTGFYPGNSDFEFNLGPFH